MKIEDTFLPGVKLIHLNNFEDQRGNFVKIFNSVFFEENGLDTDFKESYYSLSKKNVIRGMHFQIPPAAHTKLVHLVHGSILDVILDIRKDSQTYGKYFSIVLNTNKPILIYIPIGFAHGFLSLEDNSLVSYFQTTCYDSSSDKGINYASFGMEWETDHPILSERDLILPPLKDINYFF